MVSISVALPVLGILYGFFSPKKYFIANRQTGQLKVPISNKKPEVWVNFSEGFAYEKTAYLDDFYTSLFFQTQPEVKPGAVFSLADFEREDFWNFFVWYLRLINVSLNCCKKSYLQKKL